MIERHFQPEPQLAAARIVSTHKEVHAMIDLSDGLALDAGRICSASNVAMQIELELLPTSSALAKWALQRRVDAKDFCAAGGEDYQLLWTVEEAAAEDLQNKLKANAIPAVAIGKVVQGQGVTFLRDGRPRALLTPSFEHF